MGRKFTPEQITNLGIARKNSMTGYRHSEETKAKIREAALLRIRTPEELEKLAEARKLIDYSNRSHAQKTALVGRKYSDTHKANMAKAKLGCKLTEEHKANIRANTQGINLGYKQTPEHVEKIAVQNRLIGPKLPRYYFYPNTWNEALRESIRIRDNRQCQLCDEKESSPKLHVHHIDHNKKNTVRHNLISLCICCHRTIHNSKMLFWKFYFMTKIANNVYDAATFPEYSSPTRGTYGFSFFADFGTVEGQLVEGHSTSGCDSETGSSETETGMAGG